MRMTMAIISLAPIGVLSFMTYATASQGLQIFLTLAWYSKRSRLHRSSDISTTKNTMDKAHGVMLKEGPHKLMFGPMVDYDNDQPTRLLLRQGEARGFL